MSTRSVTLSMSTSTSSHEAPERELTDKTPLRLPAGAWFALLTIAALAGGAWISLQGEVARQGEVTRQQGVAIETNRLESQKALAELRAETKEQLGKLNDEQKAQRDLLIRIDENVKRLPR